MERIKEIDKKIDKLYDKEIPSPEDGCVVVDLLEEKEHFENSSINIELPCDVRVFTDGELSVALNLAEKFNKAIKFRLVDDWAGKKAIELLFTDDPFKWDFAPGIWADFELLYEKLEELKEWSSDLFF